MRLRPPLAMSELRLRWVADGFTQPESPAYDAKRGVIYLSNMIDGAIPVPRHGAGFLSSTSTGP
jgi:hypothetical protein